MLVAGLAANRFTLYVGRDPGRTSDVLVAIDGAVLFCAGSEDEEDELQYPVSEQSNRDGDDVDGNPRTTGSTPGEALDASSLNESPVIGLDFASVISILVGRIV